MPRNWPGPCDGPTLEGMRTRVLFALPKYLIVSLLVSSAVGCARGESAEERQLAELSESLSKVQDESDGYAKRLTPAELEAAAQPPAPPAAKTVGPVKAPSQRTVSLAPDGAEQMQASGETSSAVSDDPDDTAPRPTIKVQGIPGVRGRRGGPQSGGLQQVDDPTPDDSGGSSTGGAKPSALDPEAKKAYDGAISLVNGKQYAQALEAFAAFLVKWPDHPNADNATYWRGECYFAQGEYARAAEQYEGVITRFPLGNKVPDALLKLGMAQDKLGNPQKAKEAYQRLQRDFPRSEATRRIRTQSGDAPAPRREVTR
jgi:tol-pal system protein YbgF